MIDTHLFQNSNLFWPVALIAFILWMLFVWKEWSKPVKNRFYLNSLISLITVLSFALLALKPLHKSVIRTNAGVLLTNGYNQKRLDSLKREVEGIAIIDYKKNLPIRTILDSISSLLVLGDGVEPYDFWQFENREVIYMGADVPEGIIDLKYARNNILGEDLKIKGRYHKAKASNRLILQDANGQGLDSIVLNSEELQGFKLSTSLKATGKFVFQLAEKDSLGEAISSEPVSFKVVGKTNLKILLVNGFPTFETKYLKNYLAKMGHEVVVRSQLTRGRYKFEYFNTKRIPIYRLREKELEDFDLLVIDGNSFRNLSGSVWLSIEKTIKNEGLGLFVQPESSLFSRSSERLRLEFERDGISKVVWNEFPKAKLEKFPFQFKNFNGLEEIHSSNKSELTAYTRIEKGRIGATLIQNTYQLQLNGKTEAYHKFWSEIVNMLSKKEKLIADWEVMNNFPLENHPFEFEMRTRVENPLVFNENGSSIALRQNIDISSLWSGRTYPTHQGWNELRLEGESQEVLDYHVMDSTAWQALRSNLLQNENRRYFSGLSQQLKKKISTMPFNPLWFFLFGLLGLGYLWLHPKIFNS